MFLFCFSSSFSLQHSTYSSFPSVHHPGHSLPFLSAFISPSLLIEAHGGTLVHAHVSVTEKSACIALDVFWVQRVEFFRSHFQVFPDFWTPRHLWDVKSILTTVAVSHAIKEQPGRVCGSVFDKGDIVAGLNAKHSEQLHLLVRVRTLPPY